MRVPVECPYRGPDGCKFPTRRDETLHAEAARCCRAALGGSHFQMDEPPLCQSLGSEDEVYRFTWKSSFDGDAVVRIGRVGTRSSASWWKSFTRMERHVELVLADWDHLQHAVHHAAFWTQGEGIEASLGLDGATWLFEGRRADEFWCFKRWSPMGPLAELGRVFFELAGPPLSNVQLQLSHDS
ncbi:MAG TPA: hypothetical protein VKS60_12790 [Stellaceae bacterium]|nr:hypothetical protein [Stellaceae bacterium]